MSNLEPGLYEHYKGKQYEVVGVGLHTETLEPLVILSATLHIRS